jgi:hypothetical protein
VTSRRYLTIGGCALFLAGIVAGGAFLSTSSPSPSVVATRSAVSAAEVTRTTLRDTRTVNGTLGYGDLVEVPFVSRAASGIVTWIAPEGTVVERGQAVYAIDGRPVIVFYGELPFFRTLRFDGDSFDEFEWLELDLARDAQREAQLSLTVQRTRLQEAEQRLADARLHLADSIREDPATPSFVQLSRAVTAANDRLERFLHLMESGGVIKTDVEGAEYELAVARANLDAAKRDARRQVSSADTAVAEARLAGHIAQRHLLDAQDSLDALLSNANENADVALLRSNLEALGYSGPASTMVRNWQSNAGRSPTGLIEPGQIIVTPGPIRVAEHLADIGDIVISNFDGSRRAAFDNAGSDFVLRYSETRVGGVVRHALAARRGVGENHRDALARRPGLGAGLHHGVLMGAGQSREVPEQRHRPVRGLRRHEEPEGHVAAADRRGVAVDPLHPAEAGTLRNNLHGRLPF